jgi:hypothetical protein
MNTEKFQSVLLAGSLSVSVVSSASPGFALDTSGTLRQTIAGYRDTAGQERGKLGLDSNLKIGPGGVNVGVSRERIYDAEWENNKYLKEIYGRGERQVDSFSLGANRTFSKVTDTRVAGVHSSDGKVASQSYGLGVSHWFLHETLQTSLDFTRTLVERPEYEILDFDATVLTAPQLVDTTGFAAGLRHLSSPTTITLATVSLSASSDRPLARLYHIGVRQYVPVLSGSMHAAAYRGLNRGGLSTRTLYGEVDSWTGDFAWVQEAGRNTQIRFGWRVYQEREVGRAYGDVSQFGSDLVSLNLVYEIPAEKSPLAGRALTVDAGVARYLSNQELAASSANFGLAGKF